MEGCDPSLLLQAAESVLEDCVGFWAPQDQRDMELLKQVQQRVTQVIKGQDYLTKGGCETWRHVQP